jgi:Flp pilus assembly protein TadB
MKYYLKCAAWVLWYGLLFALTLYGIGMLIALIFMVLDKLGTVNFVVVGWFMFMVVYFGYNYAKDKGKFKRQ